MHKWRAGAEALGWRVTESLSAIAEPAGLTPKSVYEGLRDQILHDLKAQPDVILLQLHGAMVADGYEDTEADLVARCRRLCPDAFIGVALDLHCHPNQPLVDADAIITMKEYPHDDVGRGRSCSISRWIALKSGSRPTMALADCHMIYLYLTKIEPMASFVTHEGCRTRTRCAVCFLGPRLPLGGFGGGWRAHAGGDGWRSSAGRGLGAKAGG